MAKYLLSVDPKCCSALCHLFCFLLCSSLSQSLSLSPCLSRFPLISWLNLRLLWVQAQNQFQRGQQGSVAKPEPEQSGLLIIMQATRLPYWDIRDPDITSVLCTVWEPITRFEMCKRSGSYCSIENQNTFIHMIQTLFSAHELGVGVMFFIPIRSSKQRYEFSMPVS